MRDPDLGNRQILLIEDEFYLGHDLADWIRDAGGDVIGPLCSLSAALDLVGSGAPLDGAVLDIDLRGTKVFPLADALQMRGIPFVFHTAQDPDSLPARFAHVHCCQKPMEARAVTSVLDQILSRDAVLPLRRSIDDTGALAKRRPAETPPTVS